MTVWADVCAGDTVRGADGGMWAVEAADPRGAVVVATLRHTTGRAATGRPSRGKAVAIVARGQLGATLDAFAAGGLPLERIA